MADTGLIPEQYALAPHLHEPGCASATPQLFSSSTERSSLAPVTLELDKEASPHWCVLQMLFWIFLISLGIIPNKTLKLDFWTNY